MLCGALALISFVLPWTAFVGTDGVHQGIYYLAVNLFGFYDDPFAVSFAYLVALVSLLLPTLHLAALKRQSYLTRPGLRLGLSIVGLGASLTLVLAALRGADKQAGLWLLLASMVGLLGATITTIQYERQSPSLQA